MGLSVSQQLGVGALGAGVDPAYLQQQILQQREKQFQAIQNPQQQLAARLGSMLGGGITNLAQDKGFFDINDPLLNKVTQIQGIYNDIASKVDPAANPEQFFTELQKAYSTAGLGQQALMAAQEAQKAKKEGLATKATELELFSKNPEIITKELQNLIPAVEAGDEKALQRYNELSNLMVRATRKQSLAEEATQADIDAKKSEAAYRRYLTNKQDYEVIPTFDDLSGKRIGSQLFNKNTGELTVVPGQASSTSSTTTTKDNKGGFSQEDANKRVQEMRNSNKQANTVAVPTTSTVAQGGASAGNANVVPNTSYTTYNSPFSSSSNTYDLNKDPLISNLLATKAYQTDPQAIAGIDQALQIQFARILQQYPGVQFTGGR